MKNSKKIVIEDSYQEFNLNKSRSQINFSFNRSSFILFLFFLIFIIFSLKVLYFVLIKVDDNIKPIIKENFRSDIIDRNGEILAKSILTTNIGIDPKSVINKEKLLLNLKIIFPNKNFEKIKKN